MTADQVVGVRSTQMEKEIEELKKKNSDLETEIITIKYVYTRLRSSVFVSDPPNSFL